MNDNGLHNSFIFNERMDSQFLFELYENDYQYVAEILHTALRHFEEDLPAVQTAYNNNDLPGLKKAVHKIKPVFGFAGLLHTQEILVKFEGVPLQKLSSAALSCTFESLMNAIREGREIIETEYKRLIDFTEHRL